MPMTLPLYYLLTWVKLWRQEARGTPFCSSERPRVPIHHPAFSFGSEGTEFPPPALSATFEQLGPAVLKHEPTASLRRRIGPQVASQD